MFRFRRITGWISLSLLVLLFMIVGASGQIEKTRTKTQTPATTRAEDVSPLVVERAVDSKDSLPVIEPSDPVVRILRRIGFNAVEDRVVSKPESALTAETLIERVEDPGCLSFILCGRQPVNVEDFDWSSCWDQTAPVISEAPAISTPAPQVPLKNAVATKKTGGRPPVKAPKVVRQ